MSGAHHPSPEVLRQRQLLREHETSDVIREMRSPDIQRIAKRVNTPIYKKWWFWALATLAAAAAVTGIPAALKNAGAFNAATESFIVPPVPTGPNPLGGTLNAIPNPYSGLPTVSPALQVPAQPAGSLHQLGVNHPWVNNFAEWSSDLWSSDTLRAQNFSNIWRNPFTARTAMPPAP